MTTDNIPIISIGRYQPPHAGHIISLKQIENIIGSSNIKYYIFVVYFKKDNEEILNFYNPIPIEIRINCLKEALSNYNLDYIIYKFNLCDFKNEKKKIEDIIKSLDYHNLYLPTSDSNRYIIYSIFSLYEYIKYKKHIKILKVGRTYSSSYIRNEIIKENYSVTKLIPCPSQLENIINHIKNQNNQKGSKIPLLDCLI